MQRKAPSLEIRALRGERRADAVVLVNATAQKQRIHLRLASLPESVNATLFEVPFVETTTADVAAALTEPQREAGGWTVDLDAGMSRQLWFAIQPTAAAKSGLYAGGKLIARKLASTPVALLFGSEKFGLSNDDMSHCNWLMRIPTREEHGSMNLGQAVALCLYDLAREPKAAAATPRSSPMAR